MKKISTTIFALSLMALLIGNTVNAATVVPKTTADVQYVCSGGTINLGTPSSPGHEWEVSYIADDTNTPAPLSITGNQISGTDLKTGYYYIVSKNSTTGCLSDAQKIPVYVLPPFSITETKKDFCIADATSTNFSATVSITDSNITNADIAFQWYSVSGTTETAITGATSSSYALTNYTTAGDYKLIVKYAYKFGTTYYCADSKNMEFKVHDKPTTPTISVGGGSSTL
ncbi:hypothetical protein [Pseudopedobacter beijingensis]|uniref:Ig-like domain-containing protein n=1 Tax=Pseudopedobacter beijingensis TaxID=1207056 RepID=A0ABW4II41_9SPHI